MEPSPALEAKIREHAGRFEHYSDRITSCHVVVDAPHRHHHKGQLYDVRIHMHVPGHDIVINREGPHDHAHEDAYVAARDAFAAAERRLEDIVGRRERSAQTREPLAEGKAIRS